jgi:hypothetical protein
MITAEVMSPAKETEVSEQAQLQGKLRRNPSRAVAYV